MKKKKKTLKILSIIGSVFLGVFLLIHIYVSFTMGAVKRYITRIFILAVAILGVLLVFLSGLKVRDDMKFYESGYYIYEYTTTKDETYVRIVGLTAEGREQEYLVIPEKIDDIEVKSIGCLFGGHITKVEEYYGDEKCSQFQSEKLKKVFITSDIKVNHANLLFGSSSIVEDSPLFEDFFFIANDKNISNYGSYRSSLFLSEYGRIANVSYYYNYENSPNEGYYWIDNYTYGNGIEYIPENPMRDGYTFDGWYKEAECIHEWDFQTDTLPPSKYNEEGKKLYQETKLYAKWINKEKFL